jgi:nucleoside-diphosphate-sugar epimerase
MRVLIVGCGYVGKALGRQLVQRGDEVWGFRRKAAEDPELSAAGIHPVTGDLTNAADLDSLTVPFDWVVDTVSSSRGGVEAYRDVYLGGARNLVRWAESRGIRGLAYTSSTSVYGQTDGGWVDEGSPAEPAGETGRLLLETEQVFLGAAREGRVPATVLRVGGIYGPGRGHLFRQFLLGEARREANGGRWINMVHRDDVAGAIEAVLRRGLGGRLYNVVDDQPVRQGDFLGYLSKETGLPLPPEATPGEATPVRKRGTTDKRVSNRRLREESGWAPIHTDFRSGYAGEIRRFLSGGLAAEEAG